MKIIYVTRITGISLEKLRKLGFTVIITGG